MPPVVRFEILADGTVLATRLSSQVFGRQVTRWEGPVECALTRTGEQHQPGIDGGLMNCLAPSRTVYNNVDVSDVVEYVENVQAAGGEAGVPKRIILGVGRQAYFNDTEDNIKGMMQPDPKAK